MALPEKKSSTIHRIINVHGGWVSTDQMISAQPGLIPQSVENIILAYITFVDKLNLYIYTLHLEKQ